MNKFQTPIKGPEESGSSIPIAPNRGGFGIAIKIIVGVVIVAVVVGGVFLVIRIWKPSPEKIIEKALAKMEELNTLHFSVKADIKPVEGFGISIDFNSDLDRTNKEVSKTAGNFDIVMSLENEQTSIAWEYKNIGETSFLKLNNLKTDQIFTFLLFFPIDFSKLTENEWIKIQQPNELKSASEDAYTQELREGIQNQKEIMRKLNSRLKNKELYIIKEKFSDEKIGDINTYYYLVNLDKEESKEILDLLGASETITSLIEARIQYKTTVIAADLSEMRTGAELIAYYDDNSYINVNCQNQTIKNNCNSIKETIGSEPVIFTSTDEYCTYASPIKGYYVCIDSLGFITTTKVFPETSGYCNGRTFICPKGTGIGTSIPEEDRKKAAEGEFLKTIEKVGETPAEIWIGKKDNYLYKFKLGGKANDVIKLEIEFSNFNKPIDIKEPTDYKSLKEVLAE